VPLVTAALLPERLRADFAIEWSAARAERYRQLVTSVRALRRPRSVDVPVEDR